MGRPSYLKFCVGVGSKMKTGSGTWVEKYFETSQSISIVPKTNKVSGVRIFLDYAVIF
jgi:hypothetical protein